MAIQSFSLEILSSSLLLTVRCGYLLGATLLCLSSTGIPVSLCCIKCDARWITMEKFRPTLTWFCELRKVDQRRIRRSTDQFFHRRVERGFKTPFRPKLKRLSHFNVSSGFGLFNRDLRPVWVLHLNFGKLSFFVFFFCFWRERQFKILVMIT